MQAAADELMRLTSPDPSLPAAEQLRAGLEQYVSFVEGHHGAYVSFVRGAAGADAEMRAVSDQTHEKMSEWIFDALGVPAAEPLLRTAVRGWIAYVEEAALHWFARRDISREELIELCESVFAAAVSSCVPAGERPGWVPAGS
jgi:hypothetical protein